MNLRAQAQKRERLLASVESLGDKVVREYARAFQQRALKALNGKAKVKVSTADIERIIDEMADVMMLGFVKRYRLEKSTAGVDLNLSFSREVEELSKGLSLDLDGIRRQMISIAKPKVRQSVSFIEDKINQSLQEITAKQQTTQAATRQLRRRFEEMGLSPKSPILAETLVRTHAQVAFAAGQYMLDQDDPDDVIWGYTYVTVGDNRVRDEHVALDGLTRPKDDPIWERLWPPNGWNCRCQLIPLTEPATITKLPKGAKPDEGFDFSPGRLLSGGGQSSGAAAYRKPA